MVYQMGRKPQTVYEMGLLNAAELRIMQVHTLLKEGIKPWEWDYERYPDNKMVGRFYQDDFADIRAIDNMINDKVGAAEARKANQARASQR